MALFATISLLFITQTFITSLVYRGQWGRSSVGRALEWHSRGRQFDPDRLHKPKNSLFYLYSFNLEAIQLGNKFQYVICNEFCRLDLFSDLIP